MSSFDGGDTGKGLRIEQGAGGFGDQNNADKTDGDGQHHAPGQAFLQPPPGQYGSKDRCCVGEHHGIGQRQMGNGVEEAVHRPQAIEGTQEVVTKAAGTKRAKAAHQNDGDEEQYADQVAGEDDGFVIDAL